jgi:hypothetical protein
MDSTLPVEPMRQAFARRLHQVVDHLVRTADESTVTQVLGMVDALSGLSVAVERATVMESALRDPLASARARGIASRERLVEKAGGLLRLAEAAETLGVTPQAVTGRRSRGTVLAVPMPNGEWMYPAAQFTDHGILSGLADVLREFQDVSPWSQLSVLLAPSARLGGKSALELLEAGEIDAARSIAATYGEQG